MYIDVPVSHLSAIGGEAAPRTAGVEYQYLVGVDIGGRPTR